VGWVGVKRGEYGRILFWNWHVGGAVNECESGLTKGTIFGPHTMHAPVSGYQEGFLSNR